MKFKFPTTNSLLKLYSVVISLAFMWVLHQLVVTQFQFRPKPSTVPISAAELRVLENQKQRQKQLKNVCQKLSANLTKFDYKNSILFIDDRLKYIYCRIPKVANTNWKRVLLMLTGRMRVNNPLDLPDNYVHFENFTDRYLDRHVHYKKGEFKDRIDTYFKFIFVRDPFERLVSAYRDKVVTDEKYREYVARNIVGKYRANLWNEVFENPSNASDATFEEFLQYVVDHRAHVNELFDKHFLSYNRQCSPCSIKYDFIGKMETLREDAEYVIKRLGGGVEFPESDPRSAAKSSEFVGTMRRNISKEIYQRLKQLYDIDYALFGYK